MIGGTKTLLHALPLLGAALAGTANAAPQPRFQIPFGGSKDHRGAGLTSEGEIDLSKYTIGQILNYTLHHRGPHHGDHHPGHDRHIEDDGDEHRHPRGPPLFKLAYIVNRTESIKAYLSDPDISVTLFAPDDESLRPPPGHGGDHGHHEHDHDHEHREMFDFMGKQDEQEDSAAPEHHPFHLLEGDHEPTDEEKRRFLHKLIEAVLHYHISPSELSVDEIKDKQTIPTTLNQTKDTSTPFRIRAATKLNLLPPPPSYDVKLNFYAGLRKIPAIKAKNGIIHLISAPLLPPLTPLDQLLAFPLPFSTLTSAIQQTELDSALAPWLHHHEHKDSFASLAATMGFESTEESNTVMSVLKELVQEAISTTELPKAGDFPAFPFTIFAPTNVAFAKIPFRIRTFLFSPFGRGILKKVLSFHVVPQYILHTDYHLNASRHASGSAVPKSVETVDLPSEFLEMPHASSLGDLPEAHAMWEMPKFPRARDDKAEVERYVLPTALGSQKNATLHVNVYTYRSGLGKGPLEKSISVGNSEQSEEDYVKVWIRDGVAWGGAVHVINSLIRPVMPHHSHHGHDGPHDGPHHGPGGHRGPRHAETMDYFSSLWA